MSQVLTAFTILFTINVAFPSFTVTQPEYVEDDLIMISGKINCIDPLNGGLALVSIYNISKEWGTVSNASGEFQIEMGKYDTLLFFTEEHKDYHFFLTSDDEFKDQAITVYMEPDAIWMKTVEIIGISNLEEFKMDVLNMEVAKNSISIVSPDFNRYAKELSTGKPAPVLIGPLNYLQQKFSRQYKMKKKINSLRDE
jgi:hypothetical protein